MYAKVIKDAKIKPPPIRIHAAEGLKAEYENPTINGPMVCPSVPADCDNPRIKPLCEEEPYIDMVEFKLGYNMPIPVAINTKIIPKIGSDGWNNTERIAKAEI